MFNIQLCLTFKRDSVTLKPPLHSAIVTVVQKSSAYGYGYYSYTATSTCSVSSSLASVVLSSISQVFSYLSCLAAYCVLNVQNNSVKYKQALVKITFWEST